MRKDTDIHIRLERATLDELNKISTKDRRTISETIRYAVKQYLKKRV